MSREELIKTLKDWKPELELMAKYNDNSIDYQRYSALDESIKVLEQLPDIKAAYDKGYKDGQEALVVHLELCKEKQEPCEDCISRQAVLDKIKEVCFSREQELVDFRVSQGSNGQRDLIINFIEDLPSIQPKAKTGHWIEEPNCWTRCSCCGEHYPQTSIYGFIGSNYCPNCGAKMEEPNADN